MLADRNTIVLLLPEIILVAMAAWIYVGGTITRSRAWWLLFTLATYAAVGMVMFRGDQAASEVFADSGMVGPLVVDALGQRLRWLALTIGILFTLACGKTTGRDLVSETCGTLMVLVAGLMLVCRANNLVLLFLALEMISIPTYVLLYLGRGNRSAGEATAKYFFLSILSSAMLLYGLSFLYGLSGTTVLAGGTVGGETISGIREALASLATEGEVPSNSIPLLIGLVLVLAGLAFKIAAVPFQFYAPDVYQGTSNLAAGLLATAPKMAGIVALVRIAVTILPAGSQYAWQATLVLSILTMTIGNVSALWQTNLRRLLAYSSIAHAGYMLIGMSVALNASDSNQLASGIASVLLYLTVYVVAATGTFAALVYLSEPGSEVNSIKQLAGLSRRNPAAAAAIALFMFSLAGIPPLAGFWGKLGLFTSAVEMATDSQSSTSTWFLVLSIAGAVNAAIAAAYYLRVVAAMFFQPPVRDDRVGAGQGPSIAVGAAAALVLLLGLMPSLLVETAERCGQSVAKGAILQQRTIAAPTAANDGLQEGNPPRLNAKRLAAASR